MQRSIIAVVVRGGYLIYSLISEQYLHPEQFFQIIRATSWTILCRKSRLNSQFNGLAISSKRYQLPNGHSTDCTCACQGWRKRMAVSRSRNDVNMTRTTTNTLGLNLLKWTSVAGGVRSRYADKSLCCPSCRYSMLFVLGVNDASCYWLLNTESLLWSSCFSKN